MQRDSRARSVTYVGPREYYHNAEEGLPGYRAKSESSWKDERGLAQLIIHKDKENRRRRWMEVDGGGWRRV